MPPNIRLIKSDIDIHLIHRGRAFEMLVRNRTNDDHVKAYEESLNEIFSSNNLDELYVSKLELNENDPHHSGIGLIMVLKDYPVEMEVVLETAGSITTITSRILYFTER